MAEPNTPIRFRPLYKERVWGGRVLESEYRRSLPETEIPYGESWEMCDRPEDQTVVAEGALDGKTLHDLWSDHREEVFGKALVGYPSERFPLLIKILDAREDLSIQVHPPADAAAELDGEAKTETWIVAFADPGSKLYIGLRDGVGREEFVKGIRDGTTADLVGVLEPRPGDFVHLPSGRLHAIGAGLVIFEIQQNSDTTYRVFDWNRLGLDGKPRDLHVEQAMRSIDFSDTGARLGKADGELLVNCEHYVIERWVLAGGEARACGSSGRCAIVGVMNGSVRCCGDVFGPGEFFLVPAGIGDADLVAAFSPATLLKISIPPDTP